MNDARLMRGGITSVAMLKFSRVERNVDSFWVLPTTIIANEGKGVTRAHELVLLIEQPPDGLVY